MSTDRPLIDVLFYETYYFASCIRNILHDQFAYLRRLDDFYGDGKYLYLTTPYSRFSAFHCFLEFVICDVISENTENCDLAARQRRMERFKNISAALDDMKPAVLPIEHALRHYGIPHTSFTLWIQEVGKPFSQAHDDDVYEYLDSLREESAIHGLVEQSVRETFFLLFNNRHLLLLFNEMIAALVSEAETIEITPEFTSRFERCGVLRRVSPPKWAKRAVFFRDRGMCCLCGRDVSGVLNVWGIENYDHIVPLARGGLNDVTNIQLLCSECNARKHDREPVTSHRYQDWYDLNL